MIENKDVATLKVSLDILIAQFRKQEELFLEPVPYNPDHLNWIEIDKYKTLSIHPSSCWLDSTPGSSFPCQSKEEIESWKKLKPLSWLNESVGGTYLAPPEGYVENNGKSTVSYIGTQLPVSEWETRFTINDKPFSKNVSWSRGNSSIGGFASVDPDLELSSKEELTVAEVKKLSPKKGDILVISVDKTWDGLYDEVRQYLDDAGFKDVELMIPGPGLEISTMDEEEMGKHGWVKKQERGRTWL